MGKSTISMAMFNSYVCLPEATPRYILDPKIFWDCNPAVMTTSGCLIIHQPQFGHLGLIIISGVIELDDGKIYRKALYLMVKTMVSCRFSLKPIHWIKVPWISQLAGTLYLIAQWQRSWLHGAPNLWRPAARKSSDICWKSSLYVCVYIYIFLSLFMIHNMIIYIYIYHIIICIYVHTRMRAKSWWKNRKTILQSLKLQRLRHDSFRVDVRNQNDHDFMEIWSKRSEKNNELPCRKTPDS